MMGSTENWLMSSKNPLLIRERLLQKLQLYRVLRLIFIHAPAGYGKTVLLRQFAIQNQPVIWCQLDQADNFPEAFFRHLWQSVTHQDVCFSWLDFLNYKKRPAEFSAGVSMIKDQLVQRFPANTILILENFHFLQNQILFEWIDTFIRGLPSGAQLIISSRHVPTLKLAKLKIEGLGEEIGPRELEFNEHESISLLTFWPQLKAAPELTGWIIQQTTGWVAGMVMVLKHLTEQNTVKKKDGLFLHQGFLDINNYFEDEVFAGLDDVFRQGLTRLSVVEEFTVELADLLLERDDGRFFLEGALMRHCFIYQKNEECETYRFHPLFREFLLSRLRESKTILLRRTGSFFFRRGDYQHAVDYAFLAEDYPTAAKAIAQVGTKLLRRGQVSLVEFWLDLLESKSGLNDPRLLFLKGMLLIYQGMFNDAKPLFKRVYHFLSKDGDGEMLFQLGLQEVKICRHYGDHRRSLKLLESLETEAADPFGAAAEELNIERANNQWLNGDLQQALFTLNLNTPENEVAAAWQERNFAAVYYLTGDHSKVSERFQKSFRTKPDSDGWQLGSSGFFMAGVCRDRGELSKAKYLIEKELQGRKSQKVKSDLWFVYFEMAVLQRDMGELNQAGYYLDQAERMFLKTEKNTLFLGLIHIIRYLVQAESGTLRSLESSFDDALKYFRGKAVCWQAIANYCSGVAAIKMQKMNYAREKFLLSLTYAQKAGMKFYIALSSGFLAGILIRNGDKDGSMRYAEACLRLSAAEQYRQPFRINRFLDEVLQIGLAQGIELEFVHDILGRQADSNAEEGCVKLNKPDQLIRPQEEKLPQRGVRRLTKVKPVQPLRLFCFGEFEVYTGQNTDGLVSWRTTKAKELLAYFIHQHLRPVSRQEIITALWPEVSPEQAATFLHTHLYWARQVLQKNGKGRDIVYESGGY
jgi:LuxR family transcriptional regulator, maltose regulon positive regulatory protein